MNWNAILQTVSDRAATVGLQIIGAIVLYVVGRWLINLVVGAVQRLLSKQHIEPTVLRFAGNTISVVLNITLVVAILGYFGVQTDDFCSAARRGRTSCRHRMGRTSGQLCGRRIFAGAAAVQSWGLHQCWRNHGHGPGNRLFVTTFDTPDNVRTYVGNNKIFSDTIQNFTANPYRRVDLTAQISGAANPQLAIERLKARLTEIANVAKTPAREITILTFNPFGPVLAVRPYCHNDHYWQVYFDTNMAIREVLGDAAFPGPTYPLAVSEPKMAAMGAA